MRIALAAVKDSSRLKTLQDNPENFQGINCGASIPVKVVHKIVQV
jgi:hypothetical protein